MLNDRVCAMLGYAREELLGQSSRLIYPDDREYEFVGREKYRLIREQGTGSVQSRWRRKDGVIIDVLLGSTPLNRADLAGGVGKRSRT
jgi:PAS domain S-box-containing protein